MRTRDEIFTEVLTRNNRTTTDGFVSDTDLKNWYRDANKWAASRHKWPMTEGRLSTTFTTGLGENSDEWNFEGYKGDAIRLITIGGKRLTRLNYNDYQILKEEATGADDRVWAMYGNTVFINPLADVSGTLVVYGQYQPAIDLTDETSITVFSDWDEEANEAILEKMTSYLKRREHLPQEAELHDNRARDILDEKYKLILDEKFNETQTPERGGMWERVDVIGGTLQDDLYNRDQFL